MSICWMGEDSSSAVIRGGATERATPNFCSSPGCSWLGGERSEGVESGREAIGANPEHAVGFRRGGELHGAAQAGVVTDHDRPVDRIDPELPQGHRVVAGAIEIRQHGADAAGIPEAIDAQAGVLAGEAEASIPAARPAAG